MVELVHIGVVGKKEADELGGALLRGQVQRGLAPPGLGLEVSLELDEPLGRPPGYGMLGGAALATHSVPGQQAQ